MPEVTAAKILRISLPTLGVLAATPLFLLLDTAVVGRLGAGTLAALGAGSVLYAQVTTQLTFLSYGTTARASRAYGAGERAKAIQEGVQATWIALIVGSVLASIVLFGAPVFSAWLAGDDASVAHDASRWLRVMAFGIPCVLIAMAGNGWLRGIQNTRAPLWFTLAGLAPAAVLLPFLVQRFGLLGSAFATLGAESVTAMLFLSALVRHHNGSWRPNRSIMKKQLVLGRDLIVRSLSFQVSFLSAAAVAGHFGAASLAAHQVMLQLWNFLALVLDSLAIAAQTLTGAALGAASVAAATKVANMVLRYSTMFSVVLAVLLGCGWQLLPRLFTSDAAVLEVIGNSWWQLICMVVLGGVVFALDGVLLGAADAKFLRTISLIAALGGFLPGVWLAYLFNAGLVGVWCGLLAFLIIRVIAVVWRFRSGAWTQTLLG